MNNNVICDVCTCAYNESGCKCNLEQIKITEQLKRIDIDALNRVLDGLPVVMDSINSLQSQMQGIADTLGGLSLSSLLGLS